ncbi:hypothetical protein HK102_004937 [Quaeritorhiza haematococci]|nr:hypothetical protein HK102_004937 [Quaeritorhiza haematococci]
MTWESILSVLDAGDLNRLWDASKLKSVTKDDRVRLEEFLLFALYVAVNAHDDCDVPAVRSLFRDTLDKIYTQKLGIMRSSLLPPGTWHTVFTQCNLRLENVVISDSPSRLSASNVYFNEVLDAIRIRHLADHGVIKPIQPRGNLGVGNNGTAKPDTRKLAEVLVCSFNTILEFNGQSDFMVIENLLVLAQAAQQLPSSWYTPEFIDLLMKMCQKGYDSWCSLVGRTASGKTLPSKKQRHPLQSVKRPWMLDVDDADVLAAAGLRPCLEILAAWVRRADFKDARSLKTARDLIHFIDEALIPKDIITGTDPDSYSGKDQPVVPYSVVVYGSMVLCGVLSHLPEEGPDFNLAARLLSTILQLHTRFIRLQDVDTLFGYLAVLLRQANPSSSQLVSRIVSSLLRAWDPRPNPTEPDSINPALDVLEESVSIDDAPWTAAHPVTFSVETGVKIMQLFDYVIHSWWLGMNNFATQSASGTVAYSKGGKKRVEWLQPIWNVLEENLATQREVGGLRPLVVLFAYVGAVEGLNPARFESQSNNRQPEGKGPATIRPPSTATWNALRRRLLLDVSYTIKTGLGTLGEDLMDAECDVVHEGMVFILAQVLKGEDDFVEYEDILRSQAAELTRNSIPSSSNLKPDSNEEESKQGYRKQDAAAYVKTSHAWLFIHVILNSPNTLRFPNIRLQYTNPPSPPQATSFPLFRELSIAAEEYLPSNGAPPAMKGDFSEHPINDLILGRVSGAGGAKEGARVERERKRGNALFLELGRISRCAGWFLSALWMEGHVEVIERVFARMETFFDDMNREWEQCILSQRVIQDLPAFKQSMPHLWKYFKITLFTFILLTKIGVTDLLSQSNPQNAHTIPTTTTAETAEHILRCLSSLHFITSRFGSDGFVTWQQVVGSVVGWFVERKEEERSKGVRRKGKSLGLDDGVQVSRTWPWSWLFGGGQTGLVRKDDEEMGALGLDDVLVRLMPVYTGLHVQPRTVTKTRLSFAITLSRQAIRALSESTVKRHVLPQCYPYLAYHRLGEDSNASKTRKESASFVPDSEDKDLFEASHALCIALLANAARFRDLIKEFADWYSVLLLENYSDPIDFDLLRHGYSFIVKALSFLASPYHTSITFGSDEDEERKERAISDNSSGNNDGFSMDMGKDSSRRAVHDEVMKAADKETEESEVDGEDSQEKSDSIDSSATQAQEDAARKKSADAIAEEGELLAWVCIARLALKIDGFSSQIEEYGTLNRQEQTPQPDGSRTSKASSSVPSRLQEILMHSQPTKLAFEREQLGIVLFDQIRTVSPRSLEPLLSIIRELMLFGRLPPEAGSIQMGWGQEQAEGTEDNTQDTSIPPAEKQPERAGFGVTTAPESSPLWKALFDTLGTSRGFDYTKKERCIKWYVDLLHDAKQRHERFVKAQAKSRVKAGGTDVGDNASNQSHQHKPIPPGHPLRARL